MESKARSDYHGYRGTKLTAKADEIAGKLTGSTKFPNLPMMPAAITTLSGELYLAEKAASSGSKYDIAIRNGLRKQLLKGLSSNAFYVNSLAEGDREAIVLTGLDVSKETAAPVVLGPIVNLLVLQGANAGEMVSSFKKPLGGKTYNHMYTPHPLTKDSVWTSLPSTKTKFVFEGLEEGALYHFKVTAVGARDQKTYSEVVSQYVLRRSMESAA